MRKPERNAKIIPFNKDSVRLNRVKRGVDRLVQNIMVKLGEPVVCEAFVPDESSKQDGILLELTFSFSDDVERGQLKAQVAEGKQISFTAVYVNGQVDKAMANLMRLGEAIVVKDLVDLGEAARSGQ